MSYCNHVKQHKKIITYFRTRAVGRAAAFPSDLIHRGFNARGGLKATSQTLNSVHLIYEEKHLPIIYGHFGVGHPSLPPPLLLIAAPDDCQLQFNGAYTGGWWASVSGGLGQ